LKDNHSLYFHSVQLMPGVLGQHILSDPKILQMIAHAAKLSSTTTVLEIGAAFGNLTSYLCTEARRVIAIEKDTRFTPYLSDLQKKCHNLNVVYTDVLSYPLPQCDVIVGSIPFHITEPLVEKVIKASTPFFVFVVGEHYYHALSQRKKEKLSLLTRSYFSFRKILEIPKSSFTPRPRTSAVVLTLQRKSKGKLPYTLFIFRELFEQRDKKLKNALREAFTRECAQRGIVLTKKQAREIIYSLKLASRIEEAYIESLSNLDIGQVYRAVERSKSLILE